MLVKMIEGDYSLAIHGRLLSLKRTDRNFYAGRLHCEMTGWKENKRMREQRYNHCNHNLNDMDISIVLEFTVLHLVHVVNSMPPSQKNSLSIAVDIYGGEGQTISIGSERPAGTGTFYEYHSHHSKPPPRRAAAAVSSLAYLVGA